MIALFGDIAHEADSPGNAKAVGRRAEPLGPEGFRQGHRGFTLRRQRLEDSLRFRHRFRRFSSRLAARRSDESCHILPNVP